MTDRPYLVLGFGGSNGHVNIAILASLITWMITTATPYTMLLVSKDHSELHTRHYLERVPHLSQSVLFYESVKYAQPILQTWNYLYI